MTLHWWMHWFWITLLTLSGCVCTPVLPTVRPSDIDISVPTQPAIEPEYRVDYLPNASISTSYQTVIPINKTNRGAKAIGQPAPNPSTVSTYLPKSSIAYPLATSSDTGDEGSALKEESSLHLNYSKKPYLKTEAKSSNLTLNSTVAEKINTTEPPPTNDEVSTEIIHLNINNPNNVTSDVLVPNNSTEVDSPATNATNKNVSTNTPVETTELKTVKAEPTVKNSTNENGVEISTARALLLETGVGRRATDEEVRKNALPTEDDGLDAGAVAGICFGSLVIIGLAGAISLVLYRRRYLNKPQTLNDKCSNPDSSGYIDDSTMRENSEEMYSLDNDSFLNSLEAMTIQNYWTDSVKHTKL